jgi:radical SAM-linked protein
MSEVASGELRVESGEDRAIEPALPNSELRTPNSPLAYRERVRFRFSKTGDLRFIGHHDLQGCWERALRRAEIPVRFTEGFHPMPHLSSPLSLALGVEGLDEILEIELTEPMSDVELRQRLEPQLDVGLALLSLSRPPKADKTRVVAVEYEVPLMGESEEDVRKAIERVEQAESLPYERRMPGKPIKKLDLKPWLLGFTVAEGTLRFRAAVLPTGMARPEEVLAVLGLESLVDRGAVLKRTRVELEVPAAASAVGDLHHWPPNEQGAPA